MSPTIREALALIEDHHVEHGVPSVLELSEIREAMEAREDGGTDPATLAHDTLTGLGCASSWSPTPSGRSVQSP